MTASLLRGQETIVAYSYFLHLMHMQNLYLMWFLFREMISTSTNIFPIKPFKNRYWVTGENNMNFLKIPYKIDLYACKIFFQFKYAF